MSYFIYNNVDSRTFGLLKRPPFVNKSQKNLSPVTVPDSPVKFYPDVNNRDEIQITVTLGLKSRENIRQIYAWLDNTSGSLSFSSEPDKCYYVQNITVSSNYLSPRFGELEITFICQPFAYAVMPTVVEFSAETVEVPNNGTIFSYPEISFVPTDDEVIVTVNGADFILKNLASIDGGGIIGNRTVVIDSEVHITYFIGYTGAKWAINDHTFNDYPRLHTGLNYISHNGSAQNAEINVRERFV